MTWTAPRRAFTWDDARSAGATRHDLRRARWAGEVESPSRGLHVPTRNRTVLSPQQHHLVRAMGALLVREPGAVLSHVSAAGLLGLPLVHPPGDWSPTVVTIARPGAVRAPGVVIHRAGLPVGHVVDVAGVPVTSPMRTCLDLARQLPLPEALVPFDAAMRAAVLGGVAHPFGTDDERVLDPEACSAVRRDRDEVVRACAGWPGVVAGRRVASAADPRAESPLESLSRGRILLAGLPAPQPQAWLTGDDGREYRADFWWPDRGVVGEADGMGKYASVEQLHAEKRRQLALEGTGLRVVRWSWAEVYRTPDLVVARLRRALSP